MGVCMPRKLTKLTRAQKAMLPAIRDEWIAIGLSTEPADRPRAEAGVRLAYRAAGLPEPKQIVWCGSPLALCLTHALLKTSVGASVGASVGDSVEASVGASVWDSVWASVGASVRDSVEASVGASVWDSVWASVWASVRDSVEASVGASVGDSVWASVWASVRDSVEASVGASVWASVWASVRASVRGQHEAHWLAFYEAFARFGLAPKVEPLQGLMGVARSSGWFIPCASLCLMSERHHTLRRDDEGRLHCATGPAVAYPDGWEIYAWRGTVVPGEWITNPSDIAPETALTWPNMEQRRAASEIIGWDRVLAQLDARTIDTDGDPEIGELVEVTLPDVGRERFLRVRCGTGRAFALPVPPDMPTALAAQAWTWGLSEAEFVKPEIRT